MLLTTRRLCKMFGENCAEAQEFVGAGDSDERPVLLTTDEKKLRDKLGPEMADAEIVSVSSRFLAYPAERVHRLNPRRRRASTLRRAAANAATVFPGDEVTNSVAPSGSVGCILKLLSTGSAQSTHFLTAGHVLLGSQLGTVFHQGNAVGKVAQMTSVTAAKPPSADWGLVALTGAKGNPHPICNKKVSIVESQQARLAISKGDCVHKCGAATGATIGTVYLPAACGVVEYQHKGMTFCLTFRNHIIVASTDEEYFAEHGDSGALVYLSPVNGKASAVGLVVAVTKDKELALVLPLKTALSAIRKTLPAIQLAK